jgi:hypothetical protein
MKKNVLNFRKHTLFIFVSSKNNMKNKWLTLCAVSLFAGFTYMDTSNNTVKKIVFDEKAPLRTASPSYTFIPLETGDDNLIGDIKIAKITDDRIFILDENHSKSIQVYTLQGKLTMHGGRI